MLDPKSRLNTHIQGAFKRSGLITYDRVVTDVGLFRAKCTFSPPQLEQRVFWSETEDTAEAAEHSAAAVAYEHLKSASLPPVAPATRQSKSKLNDFATFKWRGSHFVSYETATDLKGGYMCKVTISPPGETPESFYSDPSGFFTNKKDAEHSAAAIALASLIERPT